MNVVLVVDGVERELAVDLEQTQGTVADLLAATPAASPDTAQGLLVDGVFVSPTTRLGDAGIRQGSVLQPALGPPSPSNSDPVIEVRLVGGLEAGRRISLGSGAHIIGRAEPADVRLESSTVSDSHALLEVRADGRVVVDDTDSKNGTAIEGYGYTDPILVEDGQVIQVGAVQFTVGRPERGDVPILGRPRRNGTVIFNRPPRALAKASPAALPVPAAPKDPGTGMRFSPIAMVAPAALGIGMAVALHTWQMAMFSLLSPVMLGANYVDDRRRVRKDRASGSVAFSAGLKTFRRSLTDARLAEVARRRTMFPDPAEVVRRATSPSTLLWERRPVHDDFLQLSAGSATLAWTPPLDAPGGERPPEIGQALSDLGWLPVAPLGVDLSPGHTLGVVGEREAALALVRNLLCQAAVLHGPADVRIAVLTEPSKAGQWDWVKWLPHAHSTDEASGRRLLAADPEAVSFVLDELLAARPQASAGNGSRRENGGSRPAAPVTLVVIDADGLTEGRNAPARELLSGAGGPACGIVLASSADRLPALSTSVVELVGGEGLAHYREPSINLEISDVLVAGVPELSARRCARALSGFEDPEVPDQGADLPPGVSLLDLLNLELTGEAIAARWKAAGAVPRLAGPVGVWGEGTLELDLVADGPHGLVAGTTGSGKSELLRSVVSGLAVSVDPEHLNFVLIDYKGGAAFAECAGLPHTVGLVTDLDEHLGLRALRCLEAELHYRESRLRAVGVSDLKEYLREGHPAPLPRLVVIIDEFATMAAELPDFIDSLVGIAQRGRSLGVHMILATQRPGGAVSDNIRANTNLRIALRVQDPVESSDVIGSPLAASIGRKQPGRGYVRLGPSEVFPFQAALVTGVTRPEEVRGVEVRPFVFGPEAVEGFALPAGASPGGAEEETDLERLVAATAAAARLTGMPEPRRPWPEPLPARVLLEELVAGAAVAAGSGAPFALADEPDAQRRRTFTWAPPEGNLLLCGVAGAGTTTALATLAVSLARTYPPERLHCYVVDFGTQSLAPLVELPHCGGVIGTSDRERQFRLVRLLAGELERRRHHVATSGAVRFDPSDESCAFPSIVLLIDNYAALHAAWDDNIAAPLRDLLVRTIADGPGLGVVTALTTDRPLGLPGALASVVPNKVAMRLGEPSELSFFGLNPKEVGKLPPGRGFDAATKLELQVALPHERGLPAAVAEIVAQLGAVEPARRPAAIGTLPDDVPIAAVVEALRLDDGEWFVPIGIGDTTLSPVALRLLEGEHVFVSGPPRSGKSTTLDAVAALFGARLPEVVITAIALRRSPLHGAPEVKRLVSSADGIDAALAAALEDRAPQLILVDDADGVDDTMGAIAGLVDKGRPDLHLVVAARPDSLRNNYLHWTTAIRNSRQGLALRPNIDQDGNLWNLFLPRSGPTTFGPGRGYLIAEGQPELLQAARR